MHLTPPHACGCCTDRRRFGRVCPRRGIPAAAGEPGRGHVWLFRVCHGEVFAARQQPQRHGAVVRGDRQQHRDAAWYRDAVVQFVCVRGPLRRGGGRRVPHPSPNCDNGGWAGRGVLCGVYRWLGVRPCWLVGRQRRPADMCPAHTHNVCHSQCNTVADANTFPHAVPHGFAVCYANHHANGDADAVSHTDAVCNSI